ncbi:unnamed protein product [Owenia fusiformis]|uniref:Uncharacterized protein n=1 Tax=Owenia fusiformis TaxID=6347 RepID=A0A8J1Y1V2_OWEFU|nr:unnamed protein product [Owenia fusiformis]
MHRLVCSQKIGSFTFDDANGYAITVNIKLYFVIPIEFLGTHARADTEEDIPKGKKTPMSYYYLLGNDYQNCSDHEVRPMGLMRGLAENTSAHGITEIYYSKGFFKITCWVLLTLAAIAVMILHMTTLFIDFYSYETTMSISVQNKRSLPFPAVTICNVNPIRASRLSQSTILQSTIDGRDNITGATRDDKQTGLGAMSNEFLIEELIEETIADIDTDTKIAMGHQYSDFILDCQYDGYYCDEGEFLAFYNYKYGNCFTFNSGSNSDVFLSGRAGPLHGLKLVLDIEAAEYIGDMSPAYGVRVLVHSQGDMPFPEDQGITIGPGQATVIGTNMLNIQLAGDKYSDCTNSSFSNVNINVYEEHYPGTSYTQTACMKTCYQSHLLSGCQCGDPSVPLDGKAFPSAFHTEPATSCNSDNQAQVTCEENTYASYVNGSLSCTCYPECNQTTFEAHVSSTLWPTDQYISRLIQDLSPKLNQYTNDSAGLRKNVAHLQVYYEELNLQMIQEQPSYSTVQFASDVGGTVGLYVGASLLTAFEFGEFFLDLLVYFIRKPFHKNKVSEVKMEQTKSNVQFS